MVAPRTIDDQAKRLRELAAASASARLASPRSPQPRQHRALTVAVVSGKGGVGKTNVAVNLSLCLAARGQRVALLDADLGMANADLLLDARCKHNLSHVISGHRSLDQIGAPTSGDVHFIAGASGLEQCANLTDFERNHLIDQLDRLGAQHDVQIIDCGAGIARNVLAFAMAADVVMVVTTPEPPALTDAYALIKIIIRRGYDGSVRLLVNSADNQAEAQAVYARVAAVAKRFLDFSVADGGYMLHDAHVELAVRQRCPFVLRYPRCPASLCIASAAGRLIGSSNGAGRAGSFFRRVVGLFA